MLTIDNMVAAFVKRCSAAQVRENLRRSGVPSSSIEKIAAEMFEKDGGEAGRAAAIREYGERLAGLSRVEQLSTHLGHCNSTERGYLLWQALIAEPANTFWPVMLATWNMCDSAWNLRREFRSLMLRQSAIRPAADFYSDDDRRFWNELPQTITVYRGCGKRRTRGLPWTTDRKVAEFFAKGGRFPPPQSPVIVTATIGKSDVFFVTADRSESELILNYEALKGLQFEALSG